MRRALAAETAGDIHRALALFHEAWQLDREQEAAMLGEGRLRETIGDWTDAEQIYTHGIAYPALAPHALKARADLRHREGRFNESLVDLEQAIQLRPSEVAWREQLAHWSTERGNWIAALSQWRRIADLAPHRVRPEVLRALMLLADDADPVQAEIKLGNWVRQSITRIAQSPGR